MRIRRPLVGLAALAATTTALMVPSSASAGPGNSDFGRSHRVCATPAAGNFACDAYLVDDAKGLAPLATSTYVNGYSAAQLRAAYGPFGSNAMTIAIVDAYASPNAAADLAAYRQAMGLPDLQPGQFQQFNQTGGSISKVRGNVGWGQEEMLDLEMASAVCPACNLIYVGARSASFADLSAAVTFAATKAQVISNSYGAPEFSTETSWPAWNNAALSGDIVTVSSGDSGYGVQYPAASTYVIAVGGTRLTLDGNSKRLSETAWSGAGSGCSAYAAKPSWQNIVGCSKRAVADVAAIADPATGVAVYDSYGSRGGLNWYVFGGTSVAAPIIAGIFATGLAPVGSELMAQRLYPGSGLFDVTSGSNGTCTLAPLCTAGSGWDGPTGNGTPNGDMTSF